RAAGPRPWRRGRGCLTDPPRRIEMAERDPASMNAVEEVQIDEFAAAKTKAKRKKLFGALAGGIALIGGGYYAMDALVWSKHAVTDNAYVGADVGQGTR